MCLHNLRLNYDPVSENYRDELVNFFDEMGLEAEAPSEPEELGVNVTANSARQAQLVALFATAGR